MMTTKEFQKIILHWYSKNKRNLPWRNTRNPYKILVSEVMLQQTQVSRVLVKYKGFLRTFPTLSSLANTSNKKLLHAWAGLGYWRRALYLKGTAKIILKEYKGRFPQDPKILETLPGIGPYTARALSCFAFNHSESFLDTNIKRVYIHFFFKNKKKVSDKEILEIAKKAVLKQNPREWHYALFDYGATVLKDKKLNQKSKSYHKQSSFKNSFRSFRTKVMHLLLSTQNNAIPKKSLEKFLLFELKKSGSRHSSKTIIESLLKDELIKQSSGTYSI